MIPAQFGPTTIVRFSFGYLLKNRFTRIISCEGIPSVIIQTNLKPPSAASIKASPEYEGGTKAKLACAPVTDTASLTVLKTGFPKWVFPPFPGVTPPTTLLPYLIISSA